MRDHGVHAAGALIVVQNPIRLDQHACAGRDQIAERTFSFASPTQLLSETFDSTRHRCAIIFAISVGGCLNHSQPRIEVGAHTLTSKPELTSLITGRHLLDFVRTTDSFSSILSGNPGRFSRRSFSIVCKSSSANSFCGTI